MSEVFTIEEVNLLCIFDTSSRMALMTELVDVMTEFDDTEMLEIAVAALDKLSKLTDGDFAAFDLYPEYRDADAYDE